MLAESLRSRKERTLYVVALAFSSLVWLALVVTLVGLFYAPLVALGVVLAHGLFLAHVTGNGLRLGSRQLPELYAKVEAAARKLGLQQVPEVYVIQGGGFLNAFATKFFSRRFVLLNAELIDACDAARRDDARDPAEPSEIDFIIGHELGHIALGHLSWSWLLLPAKIVPLLGSAYSRACEYSCDACGHAVVGDLDTSSRALALLAAGGRSAKQVNLDAFVEQRYDTGGFLMALYELNAGHPYLSKRVAALRQAEQPGTAPVVARNPFAYVLAPFFAMTMGGAAASFMMAIAVVGVLAAIAIPNFVKYQERARAAAASSTVPGPVAIYEDVAADEALGGAPQAEAEALAALQARIAAQQAFAPTAPPAMEEARAWLKGNSNKAPLASGRFKSGKQVKAYVDLLYKSGAAKVWVTDIYADEETLAEEGGPYAETLVVDLPAHGKKREKLFSICTAEAKKLGYEGCVDEGEPQMFLSWND